MKGKIITLMCATALLSSCHIYKAYDRPEDISAEGLYRDTAIVNNTLASDTANFGNVPWREVFTDPQLQAYIEQALTNNADLRTAMLNVESAQAALMSARLSYLPQLSLTPQGTLTNWNKGEITTKTYNIPVSASWQIDLFGQILNPKRAAQVSLKQAQYNEQAVQTQLIANVANIYYTLLMLDRQLEITENTAEVLKDYVETMQAMYDYGNVNSAAIEQSRTSYAQVVASLSDLRQSISETENSFCLILNEPAHAIERGVLEEQALPSDFSVGIPLQLLSNRPDVQAAEMALAACYYNTNSARAAFYPQITLSGTAGWTNSSGAGIVNPGKLLANLIGSLTQPLFYRGANIARLRQARAQEEQAKIAFQTTLLNAGNEVSNALSLYQNTMEKVNSRTIQVNSARKAAEDTKELFNLGTSTYLEVLTAQQSYLSAQLSEVSDTFDQMQAVINLYQALGGGRE
ncbi:MAG TPA: TolC family protein [Candidatus Bacteroides avicola]|uniref:TolC family protein n=2 Tax=Bacteroides TaxID=816 RepID=A0A9D2HUX3_9BACE|nr:TolC family protein [Mediterranea sp. An20]MBW9201688.1 TolC family protein [Bacteroidales bacterium SW292]OUP11279.1 multidrug transporter [Mediterranea sp. An20]HJA85734.1 TolC family protein [Candidatus Bacteroides avicola]